MRIGAFAAIAILSLALIPSSASAYFLPLLGAGGVIATALAGFFAMLLSAVYLIVYKLHRAVKRWRGRADGTDDSEHPSGEA